MPTLSPCILLCRLDPTSGFCLGCARSREEVAVWSTITPAVAERIWTELPQRRAQLGIGLHRLAWTQADLVSFLADSVRPGRGTWVFGAYGAVAEFCVAANEPLDIDAGATRITAATPRGAVRFEISEQVRALTLATTGASRPADVVVLALPRLRADQPDHLGLAPLGPDREALRPQDRAELLFDLGLGRRAADFCVRTADTELVRGLNEHVGQQWQALLAKLGGPMLRKSPTRVVRSAVGRVEVYAPIPAPGEPSPLGPHTHLLPQLLAKERETPPGMELPEALVPGALFYPECALPDTCA